MSWRDLFIKMIKLYLALICAMDSILQLLELFSYTFLVSDWDLGYFPFATDSCLCNFRVMISNFPNIPTNRIRLRSPLIYQAFLPAHAFKRPRDWWLIRKVSKKNTFGGRPQFSNGLPESDLSISRQIKSSGIFWLKGKHTWSYSACLALRLSMNVFSTFQLLYHTRDSGLSSL